MPRPTVDYSLYYVTGRSLLPTTSTAPLDSYLDHLELALQGGVTVVQIREKDVDGREFYEVARRSKLVCDKYNVPLFINDRLDIALLLSCHLHVGQSDLPYQLARHLLGPDRLLGVSVNTPDEMLDILKPEHAGMVDYVGIGPAFGTQTKKNLNPVIGVRGVRDVLQVLGDSEIKAVVIGGITPETIPNVLAQTPAPLLPSADPTAASPTKYRSLDGLAVVSSIAASPTPDVAARELRALFAQRDEYTTRLERGGEWSAEKVVQVAAELVDLLRSEEKKPLMHHITNTVVQNDCANLTLALNASPIMSTVSAEAAALSKLLGCLVLNLGTATVPILEVQTIAGREANRNRKKVVFDPVGVGATAYRRKAASDLLNACHVSIIKGNAGEIGALAGSSEVQARGVDSVGPGFKDPVTVVRTLAAREKLVVGMSGEVDYVSDGHSTFAIENGSEWQGKITGSGCMASSAVAVFAGLDHESGPLVATLAGLLVINIAAEIAAERTTVQGPNTFRSALIDECHNLTPEDVVKRARIKRV
ncbi:putative Thiamine phosphate synthase, or putative Hydroxyethylthiazole kinase [Rhodotorula taiwanensis]|uniref:Putative Thiamine phosphate synthase, or putative Hydroxyethylthiazole kinase n=1 Tax=Rhodotorula taiwanensis TaxID=741276 RepID=A0A2S5B423_9BASI|nr:putative Thiamine phosphate synthase, or putative Hydroxyethylthiazole kinase [Rhodotorula taiwanensis]